MGELTVPLFSKIYPQRSGTPQVVVMLHGWGLNHAVWAQTAEALSASTEVHCIDLPGHGKSSLLDGWRRPEIGLLQHSVDAVFAMILRMEKPVTLVGWSLGGHVAMHVALQYPARISKLVLVSATPCFGERDDWPHAMAQKSLTDFSQRLQTNQAATIRSFLCLQMLNLPNAKSVAQALAAQLAAHGEASAEALQRWLDVLEQSDVRVEIPRLENTPLMIVQGGRDMLVPVACGDWLSAALPHATYLRMDGAAHAPFISHEAEFVAGIQQFLSSAITLNGQHGKATFPLSPDLSPARGERSRAAPVG